MKHIFIINGSHPFAHSGGKFNQTLFNTTITHFEALDGFEVQHTQVGDVYDAAEEVELFITLLFGGFRFLLVLKNI